MTTTTAETSPSPPFFFFSGRRRHTRCGRGWSSDVCSSDLLFLLGHMGRKTDGRSLLPRIIQENRVFPGQDLPEIPGEYSLHLPLDPALLHQKTLVGGE